MVPMAAITNPMDLSGRTILVTGASSGIGRDTCVLLSELGATVVLVARNEDRLKETLGLMSPGSHVIRPFDVTRTDLADAWMREIASQVGRLDGLVHAAGMTHTQALRLLDWNDYDRLLNLNLKSSFALMKAFRQKPVRAQTTASVVLISSVAAFQGYPGLSIYSATKAGVVALARNAAVEFSRESLRVNCVVPGFVETAMTSSAKDYLGDAQWEKTAADHLLGLGKPRDVAHAIAFLLGETGRWITGASLVVDGGRTIH